MNIRTFALAAILAALALAPLPAVAAPAANVEVCITEFRIVTSNPRHSIFGYARVRDGRGLQFYINATDMYGQLYTTSFTPSTAGPGSGYIAGQEPELVRFLERAAIEGAWVKISLDASTGAIQKVSSLSRTFPRGAAC